MSTGKFAVDIGGAAVTVPGVYSVTDKSAMVAPRGVPTRAMAIIASAKGGYLGTVTRVLRGDEARLLRGGVGANMARAAFDHGMQEVFFVRVDQATPAILDLATGGLFAVNPGTSSNGLQGKVSVNSSRADAIDLFLKDANGAESDESYRMVGPLLDISYVGTGTAPKIILSKDADGELSIALSATGDSGADVTLHSTAVVTVADAVHVLNRSASWTASAVSYSDTPLIVADANAPTFTNGKATVSGGALLLQRLLEVQQSRIARLALPVGAATPSSGPNGFRLTSGYEFFKGGSDGPAPTALAYIDALRLLEGIKVKGIALGTDMPEAVAALHSHVESMSSVKERKERFGGFGLAPSSTKAEHIAAIKTATQMYADVDRLVCTSNIPYYNDLQSGRLVEQHGSVGAAAAIAIKVSSRPERPVTNKAARFVKLKYKFNTEELEDLIESGSMPLNFDEAQGRMIVVSGITTYTADANVASRKLAAVDANDYLQEKIRQRVISLSIGEVADEIRVKTILGSVAGVLSEEVRSARNPNGVLTPGIDLVTGQPVAAFRNLTAIYDGYDLVAVDFDCNLVGEIDKVRIRARLTPVRIEARQ